MGFTDQLDTNKQQMDETFTEAIQRQILSKDSNMSTWVLLVISKKKKNVIKVWQVIIAQDWESSVTQRALRGWSNALQHMLV